MVHAEAVMQQAVQALAAAAGSEQGLSAAALQFLAGMHARPACLVKLLPSIIKHSSCCKLGTADLAAIRAADTHGCVQRLLLAELGDLEAAWADADLQQMLLALPLPALQLLLSSDQLQVASEDTVLYTAQQHVDSLGARLRGRPVAALKAAARAALAPLVRAPHLSSLALWCTVGAADTSNKGLLRGYAEQLKRLQSLQRVAPAAEKLAVAVDRFVQDPPASWRLGPREHTQLLADGVKLQWRLPIVQLRQACRDSYSTGQLVSIDSPCSTPPLCGLACVLSFKCKQRNGGTIVGLFTEPKNMPRGVFYKYECTVSWGSGGWSAAASCVESGSLRGHSANLLPLAPMAGDGWDEAAWAAAGLPTSGEMLLQLHLHSVQ
jgi:hypothetical protein